MNQKYRFLTKWDIWGGLVPLLGLIPMLFIVFAELWERPHMRFFPFVLVGAIALAAWNKRTETTHPVRWWSAVGVLWTSLVVYVLSVWNFSPWLAQLAGIGFFFAWSLGSCGNARWTSVACWTGILLTTLPLPMGLDENLIRWFGQTAASGCALALDTLGIANYRSTNAIQVQGVQLPVKDVFSGYGSIQAFFAIALMIVSVSKRSFAVAICSALTVPLWYLISEFWRMLTVALAMEFLNRDLAHGFDHVLLSIGTFVIGLLCFWLTTYFLASFLRPVPVAESEFSTIFEGYNRVLIWPQSEPIQPVVLDEEEKRQFELVQQLLESRKRKWPELSWTQHRPLFRTVFTASILVLLAGCVPAALLARSYMTPQLKSGELSTQSQWTEESLPEQVGNWKRIAFTRSASAPGGPQTAVWQYVWPDQQISLTLSVQSITPTPVEEMYLVSGWTIADRVTTPDPESANWPCEELVITNDLGGTAYLLSSIASAPLQTTDPQPPAAFGLANAFKHHLSASQPTSEQILLFCESGEKLDASDMRTLRGQFFEFRRLLTASQVSDPDHPLVSQKEL